MSDMNRAVVDLERQGVWLLDMNKLRTVFPDEPDATLRSSIRRLIGSGLMEQVAHGFYARKTGVPRGADALGTLVNHLRPSDLTYLSLESRLSELGVISQIPSVMTFMTTGRSGRLNTALGTLEFVHTKKPVASIRRDIDFDPHRGLYLAGPELAYRDLRSTRRNLDLVDLDELADVIEESASHDP